MHYGDITDAADLIVIVQETQPDEIYNLAAQSHVHVWFESPEYPANADAVGTLRLLGGYMRILGREKRTHSLPGFDVQTLRQGSRGSTEENNACYSRSPYAAAKLYAHWITVNYREAECAPRSNIR